MNTQELLAFADGWRGWAIACAEATQACRAETSSVKRLHRVIAESMEQRWRYVYRVRPKEQTT